MNKYIKNGIPAQSEKNILGYEKIGKLLKMYAVPSIISILVNALYNIVDQVFIGWGVGYLANGATNVVFPITIVFASFALMFGDGSAAYLSLKLGEGNKEDAAKGVGNGILMSVVISIIFTAFVLLSLPWLLNVFGCTPNLEQYAKDYGYIIAIGLPFSMVGTTINSVIRADGSPKYAMITMLAGAVLNVILDPIFIFGFHMGVKGAALATIISQIISFLLNVLYLRRLKTIQLKNNFKFQFQLARKVSSLGISSFITQISAAVIMGIQNNLLTVYGAHSIYGADIPITVIGIVMKVNEILNSIVLGLAMGSQPIIGFNYGARKYDRVKKTLKAVIAAGVAVSVVAFVLFQAFPDKLIMLFGNSTDPKYIEFAVLSFRIYLLLIICYSVHTPIGIFLQAIGKSGKSALVSMSKQVLFFVPGMLILGHQFGITGILAARPVSDGFAFLLAIFLLAGELRHFGTEQVQQNHEIQDAVITEKPWKKMVITLSREYGSGGRYIGKLIADKLGISFYDKSIIIRLAEKTGFSEAYIEDHEQRRSPFANFNNGYYNGLSGGDELFIRESEMIKEIAQKESCVIIGRCADYILKDQENLIRIFIYGDMNDKIDRAVRYYGLKRERAERAIQKNDRERALHYKHYTDQEWADKSNYDICINSGLIGAEKTAELICTMINENYRRNGNV